MTNKTTSAIDLVERMTRKWLNVTCDRCGVSRREPTDNDREHIRATLEMSGALDTISRLQAVLDEYGSVYRDFTGPIDGHLMRRWSAAYAKARAVGGE